VKNLVTLNGFIQAAAAASGGKHVTRVLFFFRSFFVREQKRRGAARYKHSDSRRSRRRKGIFFPILLFIGVLAATGGGCWRQKNDGMIELTHGSSSFQVKSLARSENPIAKIHSSTTALSPMFVMYTSNERLFKHTVPAPIRGTSFGQTFLSQVETANKKPVSPENIEAVRARFLEMFVYKTPRQDPRDLEMCSTFSREHFILGAYPKALDLLDKYAPGDFHSAYLPAYVLSALAKHAEFYAATMIQEQSSSPASDRLRRLQKKFNVAPSAAAAATAAATF